MSIVVKSRCNFEQLKIFMEDNKSLIRLQKYGTEHVAHTSNSSSWVAKHDYKVTYIEVSHIREDVG